jgi:tetratricopeptide (TPR) repeat protein
MIKQIKKVTAVLLILWGAAGATAQVNYTHKLKGRITYLNSGNLPVIHAQVEAREGANADRTDANGYFTLVFYRKEAGVDVHLRVRMGNLVVVNEKELSVTLKKDQEKKIKLFMCEKAEEQKRQGIGGLLDKARWCRLDFQFLLAKKCYEAAVKKDPENYDTTYEFADFLYKQNQFLEARPYYESLPSLAETEEKRAAVFNDMGNLYQKNNQTPEALNAYSEALEIYKQLAEKNPGAFLSDVAMTQNNLGILYLSQNQLEKALEILSQAAATREQLTAKNPRAFEIDLCATIIVLTFVHHQLNEKNKDITHLEKADSLISDAINRLKKYPKVPRAAEYLKDAQNFKKIIDEAKEMVKKLPADK